MVSDAPGISRGAASRAQSSTAWSSWQRLPQPGTSLPHLLPRSPLPPSPPIRPCRCDTLMVVRTIYCSESDLDPAEVRCPTRAGDRCNSGTASPLDRSPRGTRRGRTLPDVLTPSPYSLSSHWPDDLATAQSRSRLQQPDSNRPVLDVHLGTFRSWALENRATSLVGERRSLEQHRRMGRHTAYA